LVNVNTQEEAAARLKVLVELRSYNFQVLNDNLIYGRSPHLSQ